MNSQFINYVILATCGVVTSFVKISYFTAKGEELYSYSLAALSAIVCYSIMYFIVYIFERYLGLDPRYKYLGTWVETMQKEGQKHASIFEFEFNVLKKGFSIHGNTFNVDTKEPYADWISTAIVFPEPNRVYYLHRSTIYGAAGDISGVTRLNFIGNNSRYYEGTGYVIDNVDPPIRVDFHFEYLSKSDLLKIIGKRKIRNKKDRAKLLEKIVIG